MHNCVFSWLFKVTILDRVKSNYVYSCNCTLYKRLVSNSFPNSETPVFSAWIELSSIAGKWKFCRIYWQWILVEHTSLYTVVYMTFLYNPTNLKVPKKAPCICMYKIAWVAFRQTCGRPPLCTVCIGNHRPDSPLVKLMSRNCYKEFLNRLRFILYFWEGALASFFEIDQVSNGFCEVSFHSKYLK